MFMLIMSTRTTLQYERLHLDQSERAKRLMHVMNTTITKFCATRISSMYIQESCLALTSLSNTFERYFSSNSDRAWLCKFQIFVMTSAILPLEKELASEETLESPRNFLRKG